MRNGNATGGRARFAFTATLALLTASFATAPSAVAQVSPPESQASINVYPADEHLDGGPFLADATVTISHDTVG